MDNIELSRRLENLIRIGTVIAVNHAEASCRVKLGNIESNWLNWLEHRAGNTRTWTPPTIGEQVIVISPSGEPANGIVMAGIYQTAHNAPSQSADNHVIEYQDGAKISYNHVTGALVAQGIKTGLIQAETSITLDTPHTYITGQLEVEELLTYHNGMTGEAGTHSGAVTLNGNLIHTTGVLQSNGVVLHTHHHPGTGGPV